MRGGRVHGAAPQRRHTSSKNSSSSLSSACVRVRRAGGPAIGRRVGVRGERTCKHREGRPMRGGAWWGSGGWPSSRDVRRLYFSARIARKTAAANTDAGREGKAGARAARDRQDGLVTAHLAARGQCASAVVRLRKLHVHRGGSAHLQRGRGWWGSRKEAVGPCHRRGARTAACVLPAGALTLTVSRAASQRGLHSLSLPQSDQNLMSSDRAGVLAPARDARAAARRRAPCATSTPACAASGRGAGGALGVRGCRCRGGRCLLAGGGWPHGWHFECRFELKARFSCDIPVS